jgi:histidine triad (HIT) family protein
MDCIFCQIVRGDLPAHRVYEDANAVAFLDIHPMVDGHTLVIPKVHIERFADMTPELSGKVFQTVHLVARRIAQALEVPAFNIGFNDGRTAGQAVPHLHFHIIPRFPNDGGGSMHSIVHLPQKRPLEEICQLIAHAQ